MKGGVVVRLSKKDRQFIEELYMSMYSSMLYYAQNALGDRRLAEEAVQDAFRIAVAKPDSLAESPNPQGWMFLTLKNVIGNIRQSKAYLSETLLPLYLPSRSSDHKDKELILALAQFLGEEDFLLVSMVALEGHTLIEAAEKLGISVSACRKRFSRAKGKLKKFFEEI